MRKDCDDATLVRVDLERKIETMVEEMEFLKKIHADVSKKILLKTKTILIRQPRLNSSLSSSTARPQTKHVYFLEIF